ncbi:hypothetical protein V2G26_003145 [Clonostachys chloroleuca]
MAVMNFVAYLVAIASLLTVSIAQKYPKEDLILCDCGIGDNKEHPEWSTSRQVNWYQDITWPDSATSYPAAPNEVVEVPFEEGIYPWTPAGVTATLPNGDVWTAYIEDGTPDGFKAGTAVGTKEGGQSLNCWAYRGRPVSRALNTTINEDAICWSAFVCNRDSQPPKRPDDMTNPTTTPATVSAPSATSVFTTSPTATGGGPQPTQPPKTGSLLVSAAVNPRFINWQNTWDAFISNFVWDRSTGDCIGDQIRGDGFNITLKCSGTQIDEDSHMTLLLIKALRDVGLTSLWFNQNPVVPTGTIGRSNSTSWVVMPEAFSLTAVDASTSHVVGQISYNTKYDNYLAGPCSICEAARFDKSFFDPLILALEGSYPKYFRYTIQANCEPWKVCK